MCIASLETHSQTIRLQSCYLIYVCILIDRVLANYTMLLYFILYYKVFIKFYYNAKGFIIYNYILLSYVIFFYKNWPILLSITIHIASLLVYMQRQEAVNISDHDKIKTLDLGSNNVKC